MFQNLFSKPWLLISTVKGKPSVVGEHWLKWGADRHLNSLAGMKPLTKSYVPSYKVVHRRDWDAA